MDRPAHPYLPLYHRRPTPFLARPLAGPLLVPRATSRDHVSLAVSNSRLSLDHLVYELAVSRVSCARFAEPQPAPIMTLQVCQGGDGFCLIGQRSFRTERQLTSLKHLHVITPGSHYLNLLIPPPCLEPCPPSGQSFGINQIRLGKDQDDFFAWLQILYICP